VSAANTQNMKKQKIKWAVLVVAMGIAAQSQAAWYDITFNGSGGSSAVATIDVNASGLADAGWITITAGALAPATYNLYTWNNGAEGGLASARSAATGTDLIVDNMVDVNSGINPFLTSNGLDFVGNPVGNGYDEVVNLSIASPGSTTYELYASPPDGNPNSYGTATLVAAPEPVSTTQVAGITALSLLLLGIRRKSSVAA